MPVAPIFYVTGGNSASHAPSTHAPEPLLFNVQNWGHVSRMPSPAVTGVDAAPSTPHSAPVLAPTPGRARDVYAFIDAVYFQQVLQLKQTHCFDALQYKYPRPGE